MNKSIINKYVSSARKATLKKKVFSSLISLFRGIFLIGICFVVLYPLIAKMFFSVMDIKDVFNPNITFLPHNFTTKNYEIAFELLEYWKTFLNTFGMSLSTSIVQLASALMVAYGFARYNFKGKNILFLTVIIGMVIPPDLLLLSRFFQFRFFDLFGFLGLFSEEVPSMIDTYVPFLLMGVTCSGLKNGLYIFMLRQYFLGFPKVIEEAAFVDGAGSITTFLRIILPSSTTMSVTVFLFSFVWQWNDSVYSPVFLNDMSVFSTKVSSLITEQAAQLLGTTSTEIASSLVLNAGIVMIFVPPIVLYAFSQRFFVQSIENSGIVG